MWDTEVDVAVIGAGIGGMANAIAVADAGGEVLVADATQPYRGDGASVAVRERVGARCRGLLHNTVDVETNEYFAALAEGVGEPQDHDEVSVPLRTARNLSREEAEGRFVEPFFGSRMTTWAEQCLFSPYGLLYTSMRDWRTTTMRSHGESIEVLSVGAIDWSDGFGQSALRHWIAAQSAQRDIEVQASTTLQRIVFEEGVVVGVELATPEGPYAVRTRAGVTLAPVDQDPIDDDVIGHATGDRLQVCLVGRSASRFGRVELLNTEPAAAKPLCTGSRRQLREGLHEARQPALEAWRCGKLHGYPSLGQ